MGGVVFHSIRKQAEQSTSSSRLHGSCPSFPSRRMAWEAGSRLSRLFVCVALDDVMNVVCDHDLYHSNK